jgi:hypothetical protein
MIRQNLQELALWIDNGGIEELTAESAEIAEDKNCQN